MDLMNLFQIAIDVIEEGSCGYLDPIVRFIKNGIMPIIQFGIPILLIVFGSIDLGKAVMSSDDKEIKGATGKLIKRIIAGIVVFFIPFLVNLVMSLIGKSGTVEGNTNWVSCWNSVMIVLK